MDFSFFDKRKYRTLSVEDGYREWVKTYDSTLQGELVFDLLESIKNVNWSNSKDALDIACGTGQVGLWLSRHGVSQIDGLDLTAEMLNQARKKNIYRSLTRGTMTGLPFADECYDLITNSLADEHIPDLAPLYNEAWRVAKEGAYYVGIGFHPHFLLNGIPTHFDRAPGESIAIRNYVHLMSDHFKAGRAAGWTLLEFDERVVDEEWAERKPSWRKHLKRPASFVMAWQKRARQS